MLRGVPSILVTCPRWSSREISSPTRCSLFRMPRRPVRIAGHSWTPGCWIFFRGRAGPMAVRPAGLSSHLRFFSPAGAAARRNRSKDPGGPLPVVQAKVPRDLRPWSTDGPQITDQYRR